MGTTGASAASAFTPTNGVWSVTAELNGQAGRGFQIIVENDVLVFSLYGYNADGSPNYFIAAGALTNNSFVGNMQTCRDGPVMGSPYKPGTCTYTGSSIALTFTSGETGTITFPGESTKTMTRYNFGYGNDNGPQTLLGSEFLFTYRTSLTSFTEIYSMTVNVGTATQYGNGVVASSNGKLLCEFIKQIDTIKDTFVCSEGSATYSDSYLFKLVHDRGNGVAFYEGSTSLYPLQVLRTATKLGTRTGPYAETPATTTSSIVRRPAADDAQAVDYSALQKTDVLTSEPQVTNESEEALFLRMWAKQARQLLQ